MSQKYNPPKLTPAMEQVLLNIHQGYEPKSHGKDRGQIGGLTHSLASLQRYGLVDRYMHLTDKGREVAEKLYDWENRE
ncbi:hypothetical protein ACFSC6_12090 [Rufibacter sediminis]|uniref:Transcriptional regulator n=1 Tax=Rufibacter sediminis TaxID=2762756 RepID=A0ABR6VUS1_9BACT|nr:hypothetical protein [Rufibacter sediminis]MBC3540622.1 hypothetical protein [Rufibacter sediminis]